MVILGSERLYSDMSRRFAKPVAAGALSVVKLDRSGGCVDRDATYLRQARQAAVRAYFFGDPARAALAPHTQFVDFDAVTIYRPTERTPHFPSLPLFSPFGLWGARTDAPQTPPTSRTSSPARTPTTPAPTTPPTPPRPPPTSSSSAWSPARSCSTRCSPSSPRHPHRRAPAEPAAAAGPRRCCGRARRRSASCTWPTWTSAGGGCACWRPWAAACPAACCCGAAGRRTWASCWAEWSEWRGCGGRVVLGAAWRLRWVKRGRRHEVRGSIWWCLCLCIHGAS